MDERKKVGRKPKPPESVSLQVTLHTDKQRMIFYKLGDGNISRGIRKAADFFDFEIKTVK